MTILTIASPSSPRISASPPSTVLWTCSCASTLLSSLPSSCVDKDNEDVHAHKSNAPPPWRQSYVWCAPNNTITLAYTTQIHIFCIKDCLFPAHQRKNRFMLLLCRFCLICGARPTMKCSPGAAAFALPPPPPMPFTKVHVAVRRYVLRLLPWRRRCRRSSSAPLCAPLWQCARATNKGGTDWPPSRLVADAGLAKCLAAQ